MAWGWAVDRPADPGVEPRVPSGHVLSETAGAVEGFLHPERLNRLEGLREIWRPKAACTDGETGIFGRWRKRRRPMNLVHAPSTRAFAVRRGALGTGSTEPTASRGRQVATGGIFPPVIEESNRG
jgi:hypothetical protein